MEKGHSRTAPDHDIRSARWAELFGPESRWPVTVLASGVALYATNVYVTASLLPNAVADIGGQEMYAWAMTSFLLASVVSSMFVGQFLARLGARLSYLTAFAGFGLGLIVDAVAITMPQFLAGRVIQGLAGGVLTGLGYAVMRQTLRARLWTRAIALLSAMWGVGNVLGPILGGLFAQFGIWRGAFVMLVVATGAAGLLAARVMPRTVGGGGAGPVPVISLLLLAAAAIALSAADIAGGGGLTLALIGVAVLAVIGFFSRERRDPHSLLPRLTYRARSTLRWIYLVIAIIAIGSTIEAFVPLFGQRLGGLPPIGGGLLGAAISWGWTVAGIVTSGVTSSRALARLRIGGPAVLSAGLLAYAFAQRVDPAPGLIGFWFVALFVAGTGIGMTFGHSAAAALSSTDDENQAQKASAGVNTVQLVANTIGSALAGVLVSLGGPSLVGSAVFVSVGLSALAALGVLCSIRALQATADDSWEQT